MLLNTEKTFWDILEDLFIDIKKSEENRENNFNILVEYYFKFVSVEILKIKNDESLYKILVPIKILFEDELFLLNLKKIIESEDKLLDNFNDVSIRQQKLNVEIDLKKYIKLKLLIAFLPISLISSQLNLEQVTSLKRIIRGFIKESSKSLNEDKLKITRLLQDILYEIKYNYRGTFNRKTTREEAKEFYEFLKFSTVLTGATTLFLFSFSQLSASLKNQVWLLNNSLISKDAQPNLRKVLNSVYQHVHKINKTIEYYQSRFDINSKNFIIFSKYKELLIGINERNILLIFGEMCNSFNFQQNKSFSDILLEKINLAGDLSKKIQKNCEKNLSFFKSNINSEKNYSEWSNKVYLVTIKTLAYFTVLSRAHNDSWKINAAVNELSSWVIEVNKIINALELDDWDSISNLLLGENDTIEWKSSFKISTEDEDSLPQVEIQIFEGIVKNILAMANTSGGVILIGLIEYPDRVKNQKVKENIFEKNGYTFFDISKEMQILNTNLDEISRQILQRLTQLTDRSKDFFNNIFELKEIRLKDQRLNTDRLVVILTVKKSNSILYLVEKNGEKIMISLLKRAKGTICYDDPRVVGRNKI